MWLFKVLGGAASSCEGVDRQEQGVQWAGISNITLTLIFFFWTRLLLDTWDYMRCAVYRSCSVLFLQYENLTSVIKAEPARADQIIKARMQSNTRLQAQECMSSTHALQVKNYEMDITIVNLKLLLHEFILLRLHSYRGAVIRYRRKWSNKY